MIFVAHLGDDDLELYAVQTLPDSETGPLEEHLLICAACRDRLTATDAHVAAMKAAAWKIKRVEQGR